MTHFSVEVHFNKDTHTVSKNLLLTVNANGWVIWRQWLHMRPQDTLKQAHRHGIVLCFPDDSLVGQLTTLKHALFKSLWQQKLRARSWYRGCDGNLILGPNFSFKKNPRMTWNIFCQTWNLLLWKLTSHKCSTCWQQRTGYCQKRELSNHSYYHPTYICF